MVLVSFTDLCRCKLGVAGESCDRCDVERFNFSSLGCEECGCDDVGSVSSDCDDDGQCTCQVSNDQISEFQEYQYSPPPLYLSLSLSHSQPNVGGLKCSSCSLGFYFLTSEGCMACNCSGLSNICSQNPNVTSAPSEVCSCPSPYVGASCDQCAVGWYMAAGTGGCEVCQCNGLADVCLDGNGTCVVRGVVFCYVVVY